MRAHGWVVASVAAAACLRSPAWREPGEGEHTGAPDGACEVPVDACPSLFTTTLPAAGATDAYYRTPFVVAFTDAPSEVAFSLHRDRDGARVRLDAPRWTPDGWQALLWPRDPLEPGTAHTLGVRHACGDGCAVPVHFTTSATGAPVPRADVDGRTYALDVGTFTFVEPHGVGPLLASLFVQVDQVIALRAAEGPGDTLALVVGLVDGAGFQDPCVPTTDLPGASYADDPFFRVDAPAGIVVDAGGFRVPIRRAELTGAFAAQGERIDGVTVEGLLDTRDLAPALGDVLGVEGPDAVCDVLGTFTAGAVSCEPCPDGEPLCVPVLAVDGTATEALRPLARISAQDVARDAGCQP